MLPVRWVSVEFVSKTLPADGTSSTKCQEDKLYTSLYKNSRNNIFSCNCDWSHVQDTYIPLRIICVAHSLWTLCEHGSIWHPVNASFKKKTRIWNMESKSTNFSCLNWSLFETMRPVMAHIELFCCNYLETNTAFVMSWICATFVIISELNIKTNTTYITMKWSISVNSKKWHFVI
jgi:hypothetical protein